MENTTPTEQEKEKERKIERVESCIQVQQRIAETPKIGEPGFTTRLLTWMRSNVQSLVRNAKEEFSRKLKRNIWSVEESREFDTDNSFVPISPGSFVGWMVAKWGRLRAERWLAEMRCPVARD